VTRLPRLRDYWYIAGHAREVGRRPLARTVLDEPLVLFRGGNGRPVALRDRCLHRNMALSAGRVADGCLECPYHGWRYDEAGRCVHIPSRGADAPVPAFQPLPAYPTAEQQGFVWVWMGREAPAGGPFRFPHLDERGWTSFRMTTRFEASAFSCLENFLDCPHTVFVHRGWFRQRHPRQLAARVRRLPDRVVAEFIDEPEARSVVSALFFPRGQRPAHTDQFVMPATSRVDYGFGPDRHFVITSQCTPVSARETRVYTLVTFRFGRIGPLARLALEPICRRIIRQDVAVLRQQTAQLRRFGGARFTSVETDLFARHIRALWRRAERGEPAPPPEAERHVAIRF